MGVKVRETTFVLRAPATPTRLLTKAEAAAYCRIAAKKFPTQCPVPPVEMPDGTRLWDVVDLDAWIDSLKGPRLDSDDAILARLP